LHLAISSRAVSPVVPSGGARRVVAGPFSQVSHVVAMVRVLPIAVPSVRARWATANAQTVRAMRFSNAIAGCFAVLRCRSRRGIVRHWCKHNDERQPPPGWPRRRVEITPITLAACIRNTPAACIRNTPAACIRNTPAACIRTTRLNRAAAAGRGCRFSRCTRASPCRRSNAASASGRVPCRRRDGDLWPAACFVDTGLGLHSSGLECHGAWMAEL